MLYNFKFDNNNKNLLIVSKGDKQVTTIVCPPTDYGCDLISFDNKITKGYEFNFGGLVIITTPLDRKLYCKGKLLTEIKR